MTGRCQCPLRTDLPCPPRGAARRPVALPAGGPKRCCHTAVAASPFLNNGCDRDRFPTAAAPAARLRRGFRRRPFIDPRPCAGTGGCHLRARPARLSVGHPERRRARRPRHGVGAQRPASAHVGRVVDHAVVRRRAPPARPACARSDRLHRPARPDGPARRPGRLLPRALRGAGRRRAVAADGGQFRTAPADRRDVALRLVGRHARPGLGHQPGLRRHEDLRGDARTSPDFFIHCGDTIYADGPVQRRSQARRRQPSGRNLVTEEKSKVAETLDEFRGAYRYNLLDDARAPLQRRGAADLAVGRPRGHEQLVAEQGSWRPMRATPRRASPLLAARGARAFLEIRADALARPGRRGARLPPRFPTARCSTCS